MSQSSLPKRGDLDPQFTWNAESVFATEYAWEDEFTKISSAVPKLRKWRGHLLDGPATLADALEAIYDLVLRVDKVYVYASLTLAVDTTDQAAAQRVDMVSSLYGQALAATSFVDPELLAIGQERLGAWIAQEPRLAIYAHYVDNLFRKQAHVRSAEVEELLGLLADPFSGPFYTYSKLNDAELRFRPAAANDGSEVEVAQGTIGRILTGSDRSARRSAWESYTDTYLAYKNTLASNLSTSIKQNVFMMNAQRHNSTLERSLFEDNIPVEVFHNLIQTFRDHVPIWHRYWEVRRKALGVERLHPYDVWAPLSADPPKIPYEQAVEWICQGLAPLGEEYVQVMRKGCLEDRWVDVYPNQGKGPGAFSSGSPEIYPFIVMNYADDAVSMGTLAHELGHSMHSYLTWENQPPVYTDYSIFVAEVASNFNQAMVRAHLLGQDLEPALQISVIEEAMANFHRYFLVMPTLARFELEIHQSAERGEGLTADGMVDLLADLFSDGYGDFMALDRQRVGISWATYSHFFADYYVFQYATGISGAHALANRILAGEEGAAEDYLGFLKAGSSMYPTDALKMAGVDLTTPEPVKETYQVLSGLIDRLEELVAR